MLHADEGTACPLVDDPTNYHFEMRCEDCDVKRLARMPLADVEARYHTGRITQDEFEAYMYVWALLSPSGSRPEWRATPRISDVRRIARKLLRVHGAEIPAELVATTTETIAALIGQWHDALRGLRRIEEAEHPDITDALGRVWVWKDGDVYVHDGMAWPREHIERQTVSLPTRAALDNPNYRWCEICTAVSQ